ncbi:MAG: hypothetical protein KGZ25_08885 [Planctomycetes bacterium]|nr:hypothetical protein [Planctomycetota bacterium]
MKIVLTCDAPASSEVKGHLPEDIGAEHDAKSTIRALTDALADNGHEVDVLRLTRDFPREIQQLDPDLVFNIAEGIRGRTREAIVPSWLDHLAIPYTGSDGLTLSLTLDKARAKEIVRGRGVRTPNFRRVSRLDQLSNSQLEFPLFVKPVGEGSSMGIRFSSRVNDPEELENQVTWVLEEYDQPCLVEEFAPGPEYCVGFLGNGNPKTLPIIEVKCEGSFYSYEHKNQHKKKLICPADISPNLTRRLIRMARRSFCAFDCRDLARVDLKIDAEGHPTFLEINPLPGLNPDFSIYPHQAEAGGIRYNTLIGQIVSLAAERNMPKTERIPS